ncbi:MAG: class I SAM-dependent methyltransferase [Gallionellaceae bacterium]
MSSLLKRLPPSVIALLLQAAALLLATLTVRLFELHPGALIFALYCGIFATALSRIAGLASWWLIIQLGFAPALVLMLTFDIPPSLFLFAFIIMLVVYWSTFRTQVPLYFSSNKVWQALETKLPDTPFNFVDLGSGIGGVLTHLAQTHPHGHYHGVEAAPLPFLWSWLRIKLGGHHRCTAHWGSLWNSDLSKYDIVFAYLSPVPMDKLWRKAKQEMRPGSVFISNTFTVLDQAPHESIAVDDLHNSTLFVWRM